MKPKGTLNKELNGVIELSREELIRRIEGEARRRLHMSAQDLVRCYRAGRLQDPGGVADIIALSNLLPDNDPIFGNEHAA
jgi:hypothetical protein